MDSVFRLGAEIWRMKDEKHSKIAFFQTSLQLRMQPLFLRLEPLVKTWYPYLFSFCVICLTSLKIRHMLRNLRNKLDLIGISESLRPHTYLKQETLLRLNSLRFSGLREYKLPSQAYKLPRHHNKNFTTETAYFL